MPVWERRNGIVAQVRRWSVSAFLRAVIIGRIELSGGEQQRVAIARAIVNSPALILADEPTGALDSKTSGEILSLFKNLHQEGRTIVVVTHAMDVAECAQRRITIHDGHIAHDDGDGNVRGSTMPCSETVT